MATTKSVATKSATSKSTTITSSTDKKSTRAKSPRRATPKKTTNRKQHKAKATKTPALLSRLGVVGMDTLEPIVLAALVNRSPLLLIGRHGTGKSYLLTRLAEALTLDCRHYNASLLNYDDLVGYPLPDQNGTLQFVQTPASIWGADAVFLDEISRCRPDLQNKLFPIIHERRVQGILLEKLQYRWAAMNPPDDDEEDEQAGYLGSEPLDAALADRFAFIIEAPDWQDLTSKDQWDLLEVADKPISPEAATALRHTVSAIRALIEPVSENLLAAGLVRYVQLVTSLLNKAGIRISPRRAAILQRNIIAVHAARLVHLDSADAGESALLTLSHALPHGACGQKLSQLKILAAHKEAYAAATLHPEDPRTQLLVSADPVDRVAIALSTQSLSKQEFSGIIADATTELGPGARHAVVVRLFESDDSSRLLAAVAGQLLELYAAAAEPTVIRTWINARTKRFSVWKKLEQILAGLPPADPLTPLLTNLLTQLFSELTIQTEEDIEQTIAGFKTTYKKLRGNH